MQTRGLSADSDRNGADKRMETDLRPIANPSARAVRSLFKAIAAVELLRMAPLVMLRPRQ